MDHRIASRMRSRALPNEIIKEIIEYFDVTEDGAMQCLKNLRLVSKAACAFATPELFRIVRLSAGGDYSTKQMQGLVEYGYFQFIEQIVIPYTSIVASEPALNHQVHSNNHKQNLQQSDLHNSSDSTRSSDWIKRIKASGADLRWNDLQPEMLLEDEDEDEDGPEKYKENAAQAFKVALFTLLEAAGRGKLSSLTIDTKRPLEWQSPWHVALFRVITVAMRDVSIPNMYSLSLENVDLRALGILETGCPANTPFYDENWRRESARLISGLASYELARGLARLRTFRVCLNPDLVGTGWRLRTCISAVFKMAAGMTDLEDLNVRFYHPSWLPSHVVFPKMLPNEGEEGAEPAGTPKLSRISITTLNARIGHLHRTFSMCRNLTNISLRDVVMSGPDEEWWTIFDVISGLENVITIALENLGYRLYHVWMDVKRANEQRDENFRFRPLYSPIQRDFDSLVQLCEAVKTRRRELMLPKDDILDDFYLSAECTTVSTGLVSQYDVDFGITGELG